jgi:hypothetical protein
MKRLPVLGMLAALAIIGRPCVVPAQDARIVPMELDFGQVEVGSSATLPVTITSVEPDDLVIYSIEIDDSTGSFAITSLPEINVPMVTNDSITVEITFAPSSVGTHDALMVMTSNDAQPPVTQVALIDVTGEGVETSVQERMDEVVEFFSTAADAGEVEGIGAGASARARLESIGLKLDLASQFIGTGHDRAACQMLEFVLERCDGAQPPRDFVTGPAVEEFCGLVEGVFSSLECR